MPSTEVSLSGGLSSGQYSSAGNCWLTERGTCQLWGLWDLEWVVFTWKFLSICFARLWFCVWETCAMCTCAMLWTHPGAFRFVLNKGCVTAFSASSQLDLLEMLVCIKIAVNLFWPLCRSSSVDALAEAPKLAYSGLGLSQLWAQLGELDELTCFACGRSACMTGFCKTHMVSKQDSLNWSRQDLWCWNAAPLEDLITVG